MLCSDKVMVKLNCTGMNTNVELGECRVHTQTNPLTQLTNEIHEQRQTYIRSHAMDLGGFTCKVLMTKKECADILVLSVMLTVTFRDQTYSVAYFHHGSYQAGGGEPGTFFHVRDIKGRHEVDTVYQCVGTHNCLPTQFGACEQGKYTCSYEGTKSFKSQSRLVQYVLMQRRTWILFGRAV